MSKEHFNDSHPFTNLERRRIVPVHLPVCVVVLEVRTRVPDTGGPFRGYQGLGEEKWTDPVDPLSTHTEVESLVFTVPEALSE